MLRIKECFHWKNMKARVKDWVRKCVICQRNKHDQQLPSGLLQPFPIPTQIWVEVSMDFVEGLPKSKGKSILLVVVDWLAKYGHIVSLPHPYTAETIAQLFFEQIFRLHGMPQSIVCNWDPTFTSHFWIELFHLQGTNFNFSSQTTLKRMGKQKWLIEHLRCI